MNDKDFRKMILDLQVNEITGREIYLRLSKNIKDLHNKALILEIADEELVHYNIYKRYTAEDVEPDKKKLYFILYYQKFSAIFLLYVCSNVKKTAVLKFCLTRKLLILLLTPRIYANRRKSTRKDLFPCWMKKK